MIIFPFNKQGSRDKEKEIVQPKLKLSARGKISCISPLNKITISMEL